MLGPDALCDLTLTSAPSTGNCCYDAIVDEPQVSYHGNIFVLVDPSLLIHTTYGITYVSGRALSISRE
jgi:hypothetical protein